MKGHLTWPQTAYRYNKSILISIKLVNENDINTKQVEIFNQS
jgi:hypothetical protein